MVSKIKDLFIIKVNYIDTLTIETYRANSENLNVVIRVQKVKQLGLTRPRGGGGGTLGYFLGGYVPPGNPNWHPVLKKISPKIDTPFQANFLYPVLKLPLKLIPRSRNGPIFLYSVPESL